MVTVNINVRERALMTREGLTGREKIVAIRDARVAAEKAFIHSIRVFGRRKH